MSGAIPRSPARPPRQVSSARVLPFRPHDTTAPRATPGPYQPDSPRVVESEPLGYQVAAAPEKPGRLWPYSKGDRDLHALSIAQHHQVDILRRQTLPDRGEQI